MIAPCEEDGWVRLGSRKVWIRAQNIYPWYIGQVPYGVMLERMRENDDGSYNHIVILKDSPAYAMMHELLGFAFEMQGKALEAANDIQSLRIRIDSFFCCPNCHLCEHAEEVIPGIPKPHALEVK